MKYHCILADPPWPARDQGSRIAPAHAGHYQVMSMAAIIGMADQVQQWSNRDAHLWLCTPSYVLLDGDAMEVCRRWGFQPKQILTWCKTTNSGNPAIGMGHYQRCSTEHIILATRGRLSPLSKSMPTHILAHRGDHSAKPDAMYRHIEAVSPGPRLELFARRWIQGWHAWGNQLDQVEGSPEGTVDPTPSQCQTPQISCAKIA